MYIKAYIEITRLVAEYEKLIHAHSCEDWVYENKGKKEKVLKQKQEVLVTTIHSWEERLRALKVRLQEASNIQIRLRNQIQDLTMRCKSMDATMSSLDHVRDAIHAMGVCPGLGAIEFHVPTWTGVWKEALFDTIGKPDELIDREMDQLCSSAYQQQPSPDGVVKTYRAAESSEIMQKTLDGVPDYNTAGLPLMGSCPNCEGEYDEDDGPQHASHHARVCWYPNSYLSTAGARNDCQSGRKAVLCVEEYTYPHAKESPQYDGPR
jgi:hypothetical protein